MRLARHVKFREEKFGGVLFETRSEKVYTLTPTAAAVVQEVAAGRAVSEIGPALAQRFSAADGTVEREVREFIAELREKGLVED
ncbi:MAG TPA: PqqD family protein [Usitatibacter sp.]|nr:PqqD family protein [Usitatibacter sp.]